MGTQGPKKPNWLVLGAFGGSGEARSWGKKAKLPIGQLKRLSCPMGNLARIPIHHLVHDVVELAEAAALRGSTAPLS